MRNFNCALLIALASSSCIGCKVILHKGYKFSRPLLNLGSGVTGAELSGTSRRVDSTNSVYSAPYELTLWFDSFDQSVNDRCQISLESMRLRNSETEALAGIPESAETSFRESYDGTYVAYFNFKNLGLAYADHKLEFTYSLGPGCSLIQEPESVSMSFQKQYEERNITFWDVLMGV